MHSRFNRARLHRQSHRSRKTKASRRSRPFVSACCSGPMAAFIKASRLGKDGSISIAFRRENSTGSPWTIRNRISALLADFRIMRIGSARAACKARKEYATQIGLRWPVAMDFMSCSIRPIATSFTRTASKAKFIDSICAMANCAGYVRNRWRASHAIGSIGIRH